MAGTLHLTYPPHDVANASVTGQSNLGGGIAIGGVGNPRSPPCLPNFTYFIHPWRSTIAMIFMPFPRFVRKLPQPLTHLVQEGHRVAERKCGELLGSAIAEWIAADYERAGSQLGQRREGVITPERSFSPASS